MFWLLLGFLINFLGAIAWVAILVDEIHPPIIAIPFIMICGYVSVILGFKIFKNIFK